MAQNPSRFVKAIYWSFIVFGVAVIGLGISFGWRSVQCVRWPAAPGIIERATVENRPGDDGVDRGAFAPKVFYRYQVGGIHYTGSRLALGGTMSSSSNWAQRVVDRYSVAKIVPVHYSPGNPAVAVLETGIHAGTYLCLLMGLVFIVGGISFRRFSGRAPVPNETKPKSANKPG